MTWLRSCIWVLFGMPAVAQAQDPTAIATAMAGRVAGIMAEKAEQKIENAIQHPHQTPQCIGDGCCIGSTCMNIPGMGCKARRGRTQCVGWDALAMKEGVCQCLEGPCSNEGVCVDTLPADQRPEHPSFRPSSNAQLAQRDNVLSHTSVGSSVAPTAGGGIPVVPIAVGLVLANVLIWGSIYVIRQRRTGYSAYSSDDDESPMVQKPNNRRFQGPGH
mmetsp:Transcript_18829/g.42463  ORF Transcript_18829/g.42463 Transcript_18829/m.42463 type:complete len:217 (+) Transcript_18829:68-718(+)